MLAVAHGVERTEVGGVVRDRVEIQWPSPQAHGIAERVRDGLALRVPVGIVRRCPNVEDVGVERKAGMNVQVAEQCLALTREGAGGQQHQKQSSHCNRATSTTCSHRATLALRIPAGPALAIDSGVH